MDIETVLPSWDRVFADARGYGITTEQAAHELAARRLADAA